MSVLSPWKQHLRWISSTRRQLVGQECLSLPWWRRPSSLYERLQQTISTAWNWMMSDKKKKQYKGYCLILALLQTISSCLPRKNFKDALQMCWLLIFLIECAGLSVSFTSSYFVAVQSLLCCFIQQTSIVYYIILMYYRIYKNTDL